MAWYRCGLNGGGGGGGTTTFIVNASHPTNPSSFSFSVMANGSTVFTKNYSCTVFGVFAETTDTFEFEGQVFTVKAQGYRANQNEKMLDFSINNNNVSVNCPTSNTSYNVNVTFYVYVQT